MFSLANLKNLAICVLMSMCFVLGMSLWALEKKREELLAYNATLSSSLTLQNATIKANALDLEKYRSSLASLQNKLSSSYIITTNENSKCEERLQEAQRVIEEFLKE